MFVSGVGYFLLSFSRLLEASFILFIFNVPRGSFTLQRWFSWSILWIVSYKSFLFRLLGFLATKYVPDRPPAALRSPSQVRLLPHYFLCCCCSFLFSLSIIYSSTVSHTNNIELIEFICQFFDQLDFLSILNVLRFFENFEIIAVRVKFLGPTHGIFFFHTPTSFIKINIHVARFYESNSANRTHSSVL